LFAFFPIEKQKKAKFARDYAYLMAVKGEIFDLKKHKAEEL
jgi:hypothetical protein